MLKLSHVLNALNIQFPAGGNDFPILGGCIDSRLTLKDNLFVALKGENTDGHNFVDQAFEKGAVLALVEHPIESAYPVVDLADPNFTLPKKPPFSLLTTSSLQALQQIATYWRRQFEIKVIGITGSVGKSSTKDLVASVLSRRLVTLKNAGNMNNEIGLPLTLLSLTHECEVAVLEMGFYVAGEIKLLCDIAAPQIGVITNVGTVHAERAGSIEDIAAGKAELVRALPPEPQGLAVLNYDDPLVRDMARLTEAEVFYYGLSPEADLWADEIETHGFEGIRCRMHYQGEAVYVHAPLIGRHSVYTILRASAVALKLGISWDWIFHAFKSSKVQLRIATTRTASGAVLIDDTYNASPDSTMAALNLLDDLSGRKVAVLGDMLELGRYEEEGHQKVGARAAEVADEIILVGQLSKITQRAARDAGFPADKLHWFATPAEATEYLRGSLLNCDMVLLKGSRSMHLESIVSALEEIE